MFRVGYGILYRVPVQFHPQHRLRLRSRDQPDSSRPAVGVKRSLLPVQPCKLHRRAIEMLRLYRVDLIKGPGGNPKAAAKQLIRDKSLSPEHLFLISQHHTGAPVIDVLHYRGNLGMLFQQRFHKMILRRKDRRRCDQHHHNLSGGVSSADQHMAQQTVTRVLVVGADAKGRQHIPDIADDGSGRPILNQAVLDIYNTVGPLPVGPADNIPVFLLSEHGLHLVAIIVGIPHPTDQLHSAEGLQQFFYFSLLLLKLSLIRFADIRASPAGFSVRAGKGCFFAFLHSFCRHVPFLLFSSVFGWSPGRSANVFRKVRVSACPASMG